MLDDHRQRGFGIEGYFSRGHLVQHNPERINVAGLSKLLAHPLFGRHVGGRSEDPAGGSEVFRGLDHLGNAEIGEQAVATPVDQDVAGFDVPMDQTLGVGIVQRVADLGDDGADLSRRQGKPLEQIGQGPGLHQRHDQEGVSIGLAEVMNRKDVRMLERGDDPGLLLEAAGKFRVGGVCPGKDLECNKALDPRLEGLIHRRHAALAEGRVDLIFAEGLTGEVFHIIWRVPLCLACKQERPRGCTTGYRPSI